MFNETEILTIYVFFINLSRIFSFSLLQNLQREFDGNILDQWLGM